MELLFKINERLVLFSLFCSALFIFTSTSLSALSQISVFLSFVLMLILKEYKELKLSKSQMALILFIVASIFSVLFSPEISNKIAYIIKTKYFIAAVVSVFVYKFFVRSPLFAKYQRILVIIFFLTIIASSISGLIGLFSGFNPLRFKAAMDAGRSTGMYGMAITYGYGIGMVSALFFAYFIHRKSFEIKLPMWLLSLGLLFALLGLYFSYSRGALIGFLLSVPFVFLRNKKQFFALCAAALILIAGAASYISFSGGDQNRLLQSHESGSNMIRVSQFQAALKGFSERPIMGLGFRTFEENCLRIKMTYDLPFKDFIGHAHNIYLEVLADTGLLGFIPFMLFLIFWANEILRRKDDLKYIFLPFFVSFTISGLFQNIIMDGENMFLIVLVYAFSQIKSGDRTCVKKS